MVIAGCVKKAHFAPVLNGWLQSDAKKGLYRVKEMDTIYSIAWAFGLDYQALAAINHLSTPYAIKSGQLLHMTNAPSNMAKKLSYFSWHRKVIKCCRHGGST
ncbi:LysM peptidoglycan-binding domain-containing protein [Coxiella-like endosymbiont]|uniref:LysM peptidoglycan-binding domain-containing protein n=1 Tax=Coxiella-like endosymbiont TaxID=1592897 RepID=UPI00215AC9BB|nr:LysM peptidoglycan-binding domain-containing protein [Coxiella-like endosymbiont]UVE59452.1 LysM peptidoglycan-binding domain-containing protein [Coxiella-like endosymbiont]